VGATMHIAAPCRRSDGLLRHRRVIDDEGRAGATNQPVALLQQRSFERSAVPNPCCHEMMKLIVAGFASPAAIGCTLLRSPGPIKPAMNWGAHPAPSPMQQPRQKWLEPSLQIAPPALVHRHCRTSLSLH
jgi:hypothetical protein